MLITSGPIASYLLGWCDAGSLTLNFTPQRLTVAGFCILERLKLQCPRGPLFAGPCEGLSLRLPEAYGLDDAPESVVARFLASLSFKCMDGAGS